MTCREVRPGTAVSIGGGRPFRLGGVSVHRAVALAFLAASVLLASGPTAADAAPAFRPTGTIGEKGQFGSITGIAPRPDGQVVLADASLGGDSSQRVYWFSDPAVLAHTIPIAAGLGGSGLNSVAVPPVGTSFYVDNVWDSPIREYDRDGTLLQEVNGQAMFMGSLFDGNPGPGNTNGLALDGVLLYAISDRGDSQSVYAISKWQRSSLSDSGSNYGLLDVYEGPPAMGELVAIALDSSGFIYVVDRSNGKLIKFNGDFEVVWSVGESGPGPRQFGSPRSLAIDSNGVAYVLDDGNTEVRGAAGPRLLRFSTNDGATLSPIPLTSYGSAVAIDPATGGLLLSLDDAGGNTVYRGVVSRRPAISFRQKPPRTTRSRVARFRFASDESDTAFSCRVDSKPFRRCGAAVTFRNLKRGRHTLQVKGTVPNGVPSATQAYAWRIR